MGQFVGASNVELQFNIKGFQNIFHIGSSNRYIGIIDPDLPVIDGTDKLQVYRIGFVDLYEFL